MNMKKYLPGVILTLFTVAVCLTACGEAPSSGAEAAAVQEGEYAAQAQAQLYEADPDSPMRDAEAMDIGALPEGATLTLIRFDLPAGVRAADVQSAFLRLKRKDGAASALRVAPVAESWTLQSTWSEMSGSIGAYAPEISKDAGDGWTQLDVTGFVKGWLSGETNNCGVAVAETRAGESASYYTAFAAETDYAPTLVIRHKPARGEGCGKYGFAPQTEGNCLSYALRDRDMILYDDLFSDTAAFQAIYDAEGSAGALVYVKERVLDYIARHKDALKIESIRELPSYDAEIYAGTEYIIALRIGFRDGSPPEGIQADEDFDYHLWTRLAGGSWAEKVPDEASRLVPGANADTDPGKYPWHQGYMWGYEKWNDYYTSEVLYFAVTKSTDSFTAHKE
jgi:hypothetical protein